MRLVLMSCCAPCSAGAIKQLCDGQIPDIDDFVVLFFNPNIFPNAEYEKRMREQIRYCEQLGVKYVIGEYDHDAWRRAVAGLESEPERGVRCSRCFEFRFEFAKKWAQENGYDAVASVFGVSRHKDQSQVDSAAMRIMSIATPRWQMPPPPANGGGNYHAKRYTQSALQQSKTLKRNMTDAERLLWYYLRGRTDFSFRKQAPIGNYIVDFVCLKQKLIVELDGAQHGNAAGRVHDAGRDKFLSESGYRVLRFWNDEVFKNMDMVLNTIYENLAHECPGVAEPKLNILHENQAHKFPPPLAGGDVLKTHRGVAEPDIHYMPIKWDENLRQQIGRASDFYRQNYCGCEFSIRKV